MKKEKTVDIEDILSLSRGEKKPTIVDKFWNIAEKVSIVFMIALGGSFVYTMVNSNYKTNGVEKDRFMQNIFRVPLTLPLTNKDIQVMIDENFSSEQKQCIKNAVEELDVELTGVTYKVELDNSKKAFKSININRAESDSGYGLAVTKINSTGFWGYINYPIKMEVQIDKIVPQENLDKNDTDYLKGIIKHEMLHTLGFVDIYDSAEINKTIMYYESCKGPDYIHDLTKDDLEMVNSVYKVKNNDNLKFDVTVSTPKYTTVEKYIPKENSDELTF